MGTQVGAYTAPHQAALLCGRRTRHPPDTHSRRQCTFHRGLGVSASSHSAQGARRSCTTVRVVDPRTGLEIHQNVDTVFASEGIQNYHDSDPGAPRKHDHETLNRQPTLRNSRPDTHPQRPTSTPRLAEYEHHFNTRRSHRSLHQAALLRTIPQSETADTQLWRCRAACGAASRLGPPSGHQVPVPPQDRARGNDPIQPAGVAQRSAPQVTAVDDCSAPIGQTSVIE